jgi:hypothetical protein
MWGEALQHQAAGKKMVWAVRWVRFAHTWINASVLALCSLRDWRMRLRASCLADSTSSSSIVSSLKFYIFLVHCINYKMHYNHHRYRP